MLTLILLAIAASPIALELFYETRLYPSTCLVVFSLLLLGGRGVAVGVAISLLAMQQWNQPLMLLIGLAELIWLKLYLDHVGPPCQRRDNGWIVLADILFWILIGIPLAFLLFGVVLNLEPASVLNLAIRQGINGSLNAIIGCFLYLLLRLLRSGRNGEPAPGIHGLTLILLLLAIVLPGTAILSLQTWDLHQATCQAQLNRLRQSALISAALEKGPLQVFVASRRQTGSLLEFRLLDGGRIDYDSNPGLFRTLREGYVSLPRHRGWRGPLPRQLDLIVPVDVVDDPRAARRGYWLYSTNMELEPDGSDLAALRPGLQVLMVEPARRRIQELEHQSSRALGLLSWVVLLGTLLSEACAWAVERQIPAAALPPPEPRSSGPDPAVPPPPAATAPRSPRSLIREVDALLQALQNEKAGSQELRQRLRRSDQQRERLQEEVNSLSIRDPLTGCFNRRELYRRLDLELRRSEREQRDLSFLNLEIDHLRQIQTSWGHDLADAVVRRVSAEIARRSRTTDLVCRLDDDQFAVLLPSCTSESAQGVAVLLCEAVSRLEVDCEGLRVAVTVSIGVTGLRRGQDDAETLINRAENALYRAKIEGRNRVVLI